MMGASLKRRTTAWKTTNQVMAKFEVADDQISPTRLQPVLVQPISDANTGT